MPPLFPVQNKDPPSYVRLLPSSKYTVYKSLIPEPHSSKGSSSRVFSFHFYNNIHGNNYIKKLLISRSFSSAVTDCRSFPHTAIGKYFYFPFLKDKSGKSERISLAGLSRRSQPLQRYASFRASAESIKPKFCRRFLSHRKSTFPVKQKNRLCVFAATKPVCLHNHYSVFSGIVVPFIRPVVNDLISCHLQLFSSDVPVFHITQINKKMLQYAIL